MKIVDVLVYVYHMSIRVERGQIPNLWDTALEWSHGNSLFIYRLKTHLVKEILAIEWVDYCP